MLNIKPFLDSVYSFYNQEVYQQTDPIIIPHNYKLTSDIESTAFVSALFAYGNVGQIQKTLTGIFSNFSGTNFINELVSLSDSELKDRLHSRYYRFYTSDDIFVLFKFLQHIYQSFDGMETAIIKLAGNGKSYASYHGLAEYWQAFISQYPVTHGLKFMISNFSKKSANKRLLMYFRWMIRKDAIDFGIWRRIDPNELLFPLDTHTSRIMYYLGISETGKANFEEACRITGKLKLLEPSDPVKFDFAISRLGILNECPKRKSIEKCTNCRLFDVCQR